jgi:hypothetical protein
VQRAGLWARTPEKLWVTRLAPGVQVLRRYFRMPRPSGAARELGLRRSGLCPGQGPERFSTLPGTDSPRVRVCAGQELFGGVSLTWLRHWRDVRLGWQGGQRRPARRHPLAVRTEREAAGASPARVASSISGWIVALAEGAEPTSLQQLPRSCHGVVEGSHVGPLLLAHLPVPVHLVKPVSLDDVGH